MFELIFMIFIGSIFIFLGWRIWKKEQITLIHDYHYTNVTKKDKKFYTEKIGKSCIIIGIGIILTGIIDFISKTAYGWTCFVIFFLWGFIMIIKAQKKYNGGLF